MAVLYLFKAPRACHIGVISVTDGKHTPVGSLVLVIVSQKSDCEEGGVIEGILKSLMLNACQVVMRHLPHESSLSLDFAVVDGSLVAPFEALYRPFLPLRKCHNRVLS